MTSLATCKTLGILKSTSKGAVVAFAASISRMREGSFLSDFAYSQGDQFP